MATVEEHWEGMRRAAWPDLEQSSCRALDAFALGYVRTLLAAHLGPDYDAPATTRMQGEIAPMWDALVRECCAAFMRMYSERFPSRGALNPGWDPGTLREVLRRLAVTATNLRNLVVDAGGERSDYEHALDVLDRDLQRAAACLGVDLDLSAWR